MVQFSLWDIFTFLLGALRWTVLLSLIAFVGGGLVGWAAVLLRFPSCAAPTARWPGMCRFFRARRC